MNSAMIKWKHRIEFLGFSLIVAIFQSLSVRRASSLGGRLARWVGPLLPVHRVAQCNMAQTFPHVSIEQREEILARMWQHWGSVCAEYCHLHAFTEASVHIQGEDVIASLHHKPCIFVSGHFGNFQLIALALKHQGFKVTQVYRQANNPWVDEKMQHFQRQVCTRVVSKQDYAIKAMADALKAGESVFILVDQKFSSGPKIPFLGHEAYTTTVPARFAKKYNVPLVPICNTRLHDGTFQVTCFPPITVRDTPEAMMGDVHRYLEDWIREHPEQWFWVHKRWPFDYRSSIS